MMELEIQGLAVSREGLLIEVSRFILATGFTLRRQRLVQDPHGILLTMVVSGPPRKQRALEKLLDGYERLISFNISPVVEGELKPHFAASLPPSTYQPAVLPIPAEPEPPLAATTAKATMDQHTDSSMKQPVAESEGPRLAESGDKATEFTTPAGVNARQTAPAWESEPDFEFIQPTLHEPVAERVTTVEVTPFIEMELLGPDEAAVDKALRSLELDYPHSLLPRVLALQIEVPEAAREATLELAGRRTGEWAFAHDYASNSGLNLLDAISRMGAPGLRALVEVDQRDTQLHILNSPLCEIDGHSGCSFFRGFLEGLLDAATTARTLSIFPVCCRSYGASECVLEISD